MPLVNEAEVEETLLVRREDGAIRGLVVLLGLGRRRGERGKDGLGAAGDELGVAEALVVSGIAKELGRVVEEGGEAALVNVDLGGQGLPVAVGSLVEGDDEVIDGLGLGRGLAENYAVSSKRSSVLVGGQPGKLLDLFGGGKRGVARAMAGCIASCWAAGYIPADEVSIAFLLVRQGVKVLLNLEADDCWGRVGKVLGQLLGVHCAKGSQLACWKGGSGLGQSTRGSRRQCQVEQSRKWRSGRERDSH